MYQLHGKSFMIWPVSGYSEVEVTVLVTSEYFFRYAQCIDFFSLNYVTFCFLSFPNTRWLFASCLCRDN